MGKTLLADFIKIYEGTLSLRRCQELIDRFESSPTDHEIKCVDGAYSFSQLTLNKVWPDVDKEIQYIFGRCFNQYRDSLGIRKFWPSRTLLESIRLKRYLPDGRDSFAPHVDVIDQSNSNRFATAILYLNAPNSGETVFPDLGVVVPPRTGRLVIFPPLWTFVHAGMPPRGKPKYTLQAYLWYPPPDLR